MKKVTAIALLAAGAWATNLSAKELPECKCWRRPKFDPLVRLVPTEI